MKLAILGAAGSIGQVLALLLKNHLPSGSELFLHDIAPITPGIAKDLNHISTNIKVVGFSGEDPIASLDNADIVLISAGISRKSGMDRSDLFSINANIIRNLIEKIAQFCPKALIGIITNPVNSLVPMAAKILKKAGVYDKNRLFGITTLDIIRSNTFVAELKGKNSQEIEVIVIGGHSTLTILPLLSQIPGVSFTEQEAEELTKRIQNAGTEIIEAKAGCASATLSMGHAAARFSLSLVQALNCKKNIIECAYVESDSKYTRFFSQQIRLGKNGIEERLVINIMNIYEKNKLKSILHILNEDIKLGENFIKN
ncbi:MAG: malate dehydrogenase [Arsenophonus sp. ET-KM2-MAG3]